MTLYKCDGVAHGSTNKKGFKLFCKYFGRFKILDGFIFGHIRPNIFASNLCQRWKFSNQTKSSLNSAIYFYLVFFKKQILCYQIYYYSLWLLSTFIAATKVR